MWDVWVCFLNNWLVKPEYISAWNSTTCWLHMLSLALMAWATGLGYWLVPGNNWGDCLLLEVNAQGRLMYCTVLWGRLYCVVHTLTGEWGVIRPRQTSIELAPENSSVHCTHLHCDVWCPGHCCTKMLLEVEFQSHQLWLHVCPFITDDYTRAPSLLLITHVLLHYWCQPLNYNSQPQDLRNTLYRVSRKWS